MEPYTCLDSDVKWARNGVQLSMFITWPNYLTSVTQFIHLQKEEDNITYHLGPYGLIRSSLLKVLAHVHAKCMCADMKSLQQKQASCRLGLLPSTQWVYAKYLLNDCYFSMVSIYMEKDIYIVFIVC